MQTSEGAPVFESVRLEFIQFLRAAGRAPATIKAYDCDLKRILTAGGILSLHDFQEDTLSTAIVQWGTGDGGDGCPARSEATVNRAKSAIRAFAKWCKLRGYLDRDFSETLPLVRSVPRRTVPMALEEARRLLTTIAESKDPLAGRDHLLFSLYAVTGMRCSEVVALQIGDYDRVRKSLHPRNTKCRVERHHPVPPRLAERLETFCESRFRPNGASLPLFTGRCPHRSLSTRAVQMRLDHWKRRSGIRDVLSVHSFRAGLATHLHRTTGDLLLVAHALGHVDLRTAERYVFWDEEELREALAETEESLQAW
ncbi:MAG: tyrosine-type recombinase/integrase [Acidobacteriota bacterium]